MCCDNAGNGIGSTVDAMSDAIEGADVMVYGVSLPYKEFGASNVGDKMLANPK